MTRAGYVWVEEDFTIEQHVALGTWLVLRLSELKSPAVELAIALSSAEAQNAHRLVVGALERMIVGWGSNGGYDPETGKVQT